MKILLLAFCALSSVRAAVVYSTTFDEPDLATLQTDLTFLNPGNIGGGPQLDTFNDTLGGVLQVQSSWWQSQHDALYIYRTFNLATIGDFTAEASFTMRDASNTANPISTGYHYGGVMIMNPDTAPFPTNNFVKIGLGYQTNAGPGVNSSAAIMTSTTNNSPVINRSVTSSTEGEVRIVRSGDDFTTFYKHAGDPTWTEYNTVTRSDLSGLTDLRIGLFAYSFIISGGDQAEVQFQSFSVSTVPEPSIMLLGSLSMLSMALVRKRK